MLREGKEDGDDDSFIKQRIPLEKQILQKKKKKFCNYKVQKLKEKFH